MDEQAKPCLSLHVNRTGQANAYGIAKDLPQMQRLNFRKCPIPEGPFLPTMFRHATRGVSHLRNRKPYVLT
jgi:hypothetical protein